MAPVISYLRELGIRIISWFDDHLLLAPTQQQSERDYSLLEHVMQNAGLKLKAAKCTRDPTQQLDHLGYHINLQQGTISALEARRKEIRMLATRLLCSATRHRRWVHAAPIAQLLGKIAATLLAMPAARLWCRSLYNMIPLAQAPWGWHWIRMSRPCLRELRFWARLADDMTTTAIWPPPITHTIVTDACTHRWAGLSSLDGFSKPATGRFLPRWEKVPIASKELAAIHQSIVTFNIPPHAGLHIRTDNTNCLHTLTKWSSRSKMLNWLAEFIWWELRRRQISIALVSYVPSAQNPADAPSRWIDWGEYQLTPALHKLIPIPTTTPVVDMFASPTAHRSPLWVSRFPAPGAAETDAFSLDWRLCFNNHTLYFFPPITLLNQVLARLDHLRQRHFIMVLPHWPKAPWWALLQSFHAELHLLPVHPQPIKAQPPLSIHTKAHRWMWCFIHHHPDHDTTAPDTASQQPHASRQQPEILLQHPMDRCIASEYDSHIRQHGKFRLADTTLCKELETVWASPIAASIFAAFDELAVARSSPFAESSLVTNSN